jgi:hypothetical protein
MPWLSLAPYKTSPPMRSTSIKVLPFRYKKVCLLVNHMQKQFADMFVSEKNLSNDEAMIRYFRNSGLKQAIRSKPRS